MRHALLRLRYGVPILLAALVAVIAAAPVAAEGGPGAGAGASPDALRLGGFRQQLALVTVISDLPKPEAATVNYRQVRKQTALARHLAPGEATVTVVPAGQGGVVGNAGGARLDAAQLSARAGASYCVFVIDTVGGPRIKVLGEGRVRGSLFNPHPDERCAQALLFYKKFGIWR
ncbi:MAG: hypothetical protein ACK2UL_03045 [Anaerolineae bacterium]